MKTFFASAMLSAVASAATYNGGTAENPTAITSFIMDLSNTFPCSFQSSTTSIVSSANYGAVLDALKLNEVSGVALPFFPDSTSVGGDGVMTYKACN